jgi:phage gp36-like protein
VSAYCTVEDLESYFLNKEFKCGDYLTNGKADGFILDDGALIDATIKSRYSLPVTDTNDLMILKSINTKMVVGTIDDIFREKNAEGQFERGRNTRKEALELLKQIKEGDLILDGVENTSVMKFNDIDSDGETVLPKFKDSNIANE